MPIANQVSAAGGVTYLTVQRFELQRRIVDFLRDGWQLAYIIPAQGQQNTTSINALAYVALASGQAANLVPTPTYWVNLTPNVDIFDVCLVRLSSPEKEPCPRCSYPYPNPERIDRDA